MGVSSSSPRKVTVARIEDDPNVIAVTESVLKQLAEPRKARPEDSVAKKTTVPRYDDRNEERSRAFRGDDRQSLEWYQLWKQNEAERNEEMKKKEEEWSNHLKQIDEKLESQKNRAIEDADNAVESIRNRLNLSLKTGSNACNDLRDALLACYVNHSRQPLHCSEATKAFVECAKKVRNEQKG
ncbi:uncharacterized protein [Oscarella lobularis]|uniref:uncharacterized protein n=1 Tax=Oscarella lobularis TaxID=121494 RepID=UPI0033143262